MERWFKVYFEGQGHTLYFDVPSWVCQSWIYRARMFPLRRLRWAGRVAQLGCNGRWKRSGGLDRASPFSEWMDNRLEWPVEGELRECRLGRGDVDPPPPYQVSLWPELVGLRVWICAGCGPLRYQPVGWVVARWSGLVDGREGGVVAGCGRWLHSLALNCGTG